MAEEVWHSKSEVTTMLQQFHEKYARQPMAAINEARPIHTRYTDYLADELRGLGLCSRVEYTGSAYEGVKVSNDIEFDIMVVKTGSHLKIWQTSNPGYYYLEEDDGCYVSSKKKLADICGTLQKLINKHPDMSRLVMLRYHGPATQMDVYRDEMDRIRNKVWYSVDIVLLYEDINLKHQCVAKPLKSNECHPEAETWRISFSMEEKKLFIGMDRDNGCRKKVLRILKVWRNREPGMCQLTSYHLKTALFYEMKEGRNWSQSELGQRLIGVLRRLYGDLEQSRQPHYFDPQVNLLDGIKKQTIENMECRLERILRLEPVFRGLFELK